MKIMKTVMFLYLLLLSIGPIPSANATDELVVTESGNVGIGTDDPATILTIRKPDPVLTLENINYNYGGGGVLRFGHDQAGSTIPIGEIRGFLYNGSASRAGGISIWTAYAGILNEQLSVLYNGNVGIGTNIPTAKLSVNGNIRLFNSDPYIQVDTTDKHLVLSGGNGWTTTGATMVLRGADSTYNPHGIELSAGAVERLRILKNGNVGIGTTVPAEKLHVAGNIKVEGIVIDESGTSDARLKVNVETITNALEKVNQIRGVSFNWVDRSRGTDTELGVIAQEVETVFPELVRYDSDGYRSVDYKKIVAPLIEAIKELRALNERLSGENEFLAEGYDQLEMENQSLKLDVAILFKRIEAIEKQHQ